MLVVDGAVVVVVDVVVDEVVVEEVVLDVLVLVVEPGGPEWQWFLSPLPNPGRHGADVDELA